jgi:transcriptional regulator with XRE-family HTH domain
MQLTQRGCSVDVCLAIKQRLEKLGLEQRDLAAAAEVTESYISQLLTRKKSPPAPGRTDIYDKMGKFLKLPGGKLAKLAEHQRKEELRRNLADPPKPLFKEVRELILRKCAPAKEKQIRVIFEKQPFGELERLVTQKLLDTDVFNLSPENCVSFLDPVIESWDVDLTTFGMEIVLNRRIASGDPRRFEFVETGPEQPAVEPGFKEFLNDSSLSGTATKEELELLRNLGFNGKRPTAIYYYRELQSLRDPLHFRAGNRSSMKNSGRNDC